MKALLRTSKIAVMLLGDDAAETQVSRVRITILDYRMVLAWALAILGFLVVALIFGPQIIRAMR